MKYSHKKHYKELCQYVRDNWDVSEAHEQYAWEVVERMRCPVGDDIQDSIMYAVSDYAMDNDFDEDDIWDIEDADQIFWDLPPRED